MSTMANTPLWLRWCWDGDFQGDLKKIGMANGEACLHGLSFGSVVMFTSGMFPCMDISGRVPMKRCRRRFAARGANTMLFMWGCPRRNHVCMTIVS
jgi:hypothetical protein